MNVRLKFLNSFFAELDAAGVWHVVLRNHEDIFAGKEKDVDMMCSIADFQLIHEVFSKVCSENGHICNWNVKGKTMSFSIKGKSFKSINNDFSRELIIDMVAFVSIRDSSLKLNVPGYSKRFRSSQIQRERMILKDFTCWAPSSDWLILLLLEKMQYKRKPVYKNKIESLLLNPSSKIGANADLVLDIQLSLKVDSTERTRLLAVKRSLNEINYKSNFLEVIKEWYWLAKVNVWSLVKKKGLIITFSGPDGAGKSTTQLHLINFLKKDIGLSVNSIRGFNRLNEPKFMGSTLKKVQHNVRGVNQKTADELENDFRDRKPKKGKSLSWKLRRLLGLLFIIVQYPIFYFVAWIRTYRGISTVVDTSVFDRFVKAHRPRFRLLEKIATPLLPSGDITFRLYASPEVIHKRKPELSIQELDEYYSAMDYIFSLKPNSNIKIIETHLGASIAAKIVQEHVMYELGFCEI